MIVFLHGVPLDGTVWGPQLEAFPGALAPDLPGFGSRQLEGEADLGELEPISEGAHLVGHSFGAAVAIDLALRRSGAVRSLTLANPLLLGRSSNLAAWSTCVERDGRRYRRRPRGLVGMSAVRRRTRSG